MIWSIDAVVGGNAGELFVDHQLTHFLERRVFANGDNARARRHHFTHGFVAESDHGLDQFAVAFFDDALFFAGRDQGFDVFFRPRRLFLGLGVAQFE